MTFKDELELSWDAPVHTDETFPATVPSVVQVHPLQELAQSSVNTDENELVQVHNLQC